MIDLSGKVAVVTGASKGIGAGIAKELAAAGAAVVVNYASNKSDAENVVEEIRNKGGKAIAIQADVSNANQVDDMFRVTVDHFGRPNILVNNAGVFGFGPLETASFESFSRLYATNVWGPIQMTQRALSSFAEDGGSVINICSGVTRMLSSGSTLYAGSKGALDLITVVLSKELGPRNIRVNAISPGATETEGAHTVGAMSAASRDQYSAATPLGRIGQPVDIARIAVFLASDEAAWITGEVIHATGGLR